MYKLKRSAPLATARAFHSRWEVDGGFGESSERHVLRDVTEQLVPEEKLVPFLGIHQSPNLGVLQLQAIVEVSTPELWRQPSQITEYLRRRQNDPSYMACCTRGSKPQGRDC